MVQAALLAWYATHRRDLPWRRANDPYSILVSEIMLQQTQVDRVVPRYLDFLRRFPDFAALAAAGPGDVIRAWAPLGYNQRAVRLQRMAVRIMREHGGRMPEDPGLLRNLEGVGEYTAAALLSIAFGKDVGVVDTNVRRVLGRVFWGEAKPAPKALAGMAGALVPPGRSRDWNQALMDLGAMVCLSRKPACGACPLRRGCDAAPLLASGRLRAAEERATYRAAPFKGSSRYYRGRILHRLRALAVGEAVGLQDLGAAVKPDYAIEDLDWLAGLVAGLERDGLARVHSADIAGEARVSLP